MTKLHNMGKAHNFNSQSRFGVIGYEIFTDADDESLMKYLIETLLKIRVVLIPCAAFALLACAGNAPKPQLVVEPENVTMRLAQAADRASAALDTLAAIEQVRTPTDLPPLTENAPPELRRSVTVNWIGPVEPMTKQLADRASYNFVTSGNPPEIPLIISLNTRNQPVIETLRDIGLQLGGRGELRVDPNLRVIELSYGNVQVEDVE